MTVSIVTPVVRYAGFERMVESVRETAGNSVEIVAVAAKNPGIDGVLFVEVPDTVSAVDRWNAGAAAASGDYLVLGADDIEFGDGWLDAAVRGMRVLNGQGVVGFNDGTDRPGGASHFMISRGRVVADMGGVLVPPVYGHFFVDNEVVERASRDEMYIYAEGARIRHSHPQLGTGDTDDWYTKASASFQSDWDLFHDRRARGFPNDWERVVGWPRRAQDGSKSVAIAPRVYRYPDVGFFASWTNLLLFGLNKGDFVILPSTSSPPAHIAANIAIQQFLRTGRDWLLFIDDDMEFRQDALVQMRSDMERSGADVLMGFCTHRTPPPHAVVMRETAEQPGLPVSMAGVRYGTLAVSDEYDNSIIDVDAVGLAFTMIRREVLEAFTNEYGAAQTYDYVQWGPGYQGEDTTFSRRAKECGFRLAVTTSVKIEHVGRTTQGWNEHQAMLANRGKSE